MKDTAAQPTNSGSSYDAIATNSSVAEIRDVEIAHKKSADTREVALLVVAMVVIAMALRPGISSIGPVLPLISREFSLSHAVASLLTTIPTLLMGLLALPTPWLARRLGRSWVLLASLVLLFVSMAARTFAPNVSMLLLTTAGVGAGIAISGTLFAGIIKARFPRKVAMMMSIYATALAFSSTVSAAATGPIAAFAGENGWRLGTGIWSPIALIAVFAGLAILVWERRKPAVGTAAAASADGPAAIAANGAPQIDPNGLGVRLFAQACEGCHLPNGTGRQSPWAALAGAQSVGDPNGTNIVAILTQGSSISTSDGTMFMHPFTGGYTDAELVALGNYTIGQFGFRQGSITPQRIESAKTRAPAP